jgi:hypothetical protein
LSASIIPCARSAYLSGFYGCFKAVLSIGSGKDREKIRARRVKVRACLDRGKLDVIVRS